MAARRRSVIVLAGGLRDDLQDFARPLGGDDGLAVENPTAFGKQQLADSIGRGFARLVEGDG